MPKERNKADSYREKAYEGDTKAMNNLGVCYERGTGVKVSLGNGTEKDHHKAFLWYREAAFQGHILSQKNVGAAYWNGDGVEKNLEECGYPPRDYQSRGLLPSGMNLLPTVVMLRHSSLQAGS